MRKKMDLVVGKVLNLEKKRVKISSSWLGDKSTLVDASLIVKKKSIKEMKVKDFGHFVN